MTGVIESQPLSQFVPGFVYDISSLLALQLIEMRGAIDEPFPDPAHVINDDDMELEGPLLGGVHVSQPDTTDDRPHRRRRKIR